MMESQQTVCVKRLREKFPVEVVKAAVLFGMQALGYDEPTDQQMHILQAFWFGSDVFACLPTGSGKSLCYAALPSAFGYLRFMSKGNLQGREITSSCIVVVGPQFIQITLWDLLLMKPIALKSGEFMYELYDSN